MKTALVYYSLTGNAHLAARRIAETLNADLIRLEPEKAYPDSGFRKFYWGGKSAVMGETPALKPHSFSPADYDRVILGTPIWAGTFAPPLRTLIREHAGQWRGKSVAVFASSGGGSAEKALDRLKKELDIPSFAATLSLVDPKDRPAPENERKITDFCHALEKM
jgi:flavodoxin